MLRITHPILMMVFFVLIGVPTLVRATTVTVGSTTIGAGQVFSIPIFISGSVDLTSFQFDLSFDQTSMQALSVAEGTDFADAAVAGGGFTSFGPGAIDNSSGLVSFVSDVMEGMLGPGLEPGGILATIQFEALAAGVFQFDLSNAFLIEDGLVLSSANADFDLAPGLVTVTSAVPEPGTLVLLVLGLLLPCANRMGQRYRLAKFLERTHINH